MMVSCHHPRGPCFYCWADNSALLFGANYQGLLSLTLSTNLSCVVWLGSQFVSRWVLASIAYSVTLVAVPYLIRRSFLSHNPWQVLYVGVRSILRFKCFFKSEAHRPVIKCAVLPLGVTLLWPPSGRKQIICLFRSRDGSEKLCSLLLSYLITFFQIRIKCCLL